MPLTHTRRQSSPIRLLTCITTLFVITLTASAEESPWATLEPIRLQIESDSEPLANDPNRNAQGKYSALSNSLVVIETFTNHTEEYVLQRVTQFLPRLNFSSYEPLFSESETQLTTSLTNLAAASAETVNGLPDSKDARKAGKQLAKLEKALAQLDSTTDTWKRTARLNAARRAYDKLAATLARIAG
jgi:hypothetical protein